MQAPLLAFGLFLLLHCHNGDCSTTAFPVDGATAPSARSAACPKCTIGCGPKFEGAKAAADACMQHADENDAKDNVFQFDEWKDHVCACANAYDIATESCGTDASVGLQVRSHGRGYEMKCRGLGWGLWCWKWGLSSLVCICCILACGCSEYCCGFFTKSARCCAACFDKDEAEEDDSSLLPSPRDAREIMTKETFGHNVDLPSSYFDANKGSHD